MAPRQAEADVELDDDADVEAQSPAVVMAARPIFCTNCKFEAPNLDEAGKHLERHRPMGTPIHSRKGKLLSVMCPRECGRFFTRGIHRGLAEGVHNEIGELKTHVGRCDGSRRLPTDKEEEEMAKRGKSFKRKPTEPTSAPETRAEGCPACPNEIFKTGHARGAHFRSQHPDWKSDRRFNPHAPPGASPRATGNETTLEVPSRAEAPIPSRKPSEGGDVDVEAFDMAKKSISQMRDAVSSLRDKGNDFIKRADELEAKADAMEKALED